MRWLGLVTALTIGCAMTPTLHVAPPPRCVCASPASASAATSVARSPDDEADLKVAIASEATASAIRADTRLACAWVDDRARAELEKLEPEVLRGIRDARKARAAEDSIPSAERMFTAWSLYDAAVDGARDKLAAVIAEPLTDALVEAPNVTNALNAAIAEVVGPDFVKVVLPGYLAMARRRAPEVLPAKFAEASARCANIVIDRERSRWLAVFKSEL